MFYPQPLDSFPVPAWVGIFGLGLKEKCGAAIGEGPVHHVAVPCDPPNIRHASEQLSGLVVESEVMGDGRVEQVTRRAVNQTLEMKALLGL